MANIRIYNSEKILITTNNKRYNEGMISAEEYNEFKETQMANLDTFLMMGRITSEQYKTLNDMFLVIEEPVAEEVPPVEEPDGSPAE